MSEQDSKENSTGRNTFRSAGGKLDEAAERLEREAEQLIRYLNDEVVPAIRSQSTRALRTAADKMQSFADYMEKHKKSE